MLKRMETEPYILHALEFDGKGGAIPLSGAEISQKIHDDQLTWVHLDATDPRSRQWIEREVNYLDALIVQALLEEDTRPRLEEFDHGILLILRGANLNESADPEDMVSIRLWIDQHRVISLRRRRSKAAEDLRQQLEVGKGPHQAGDFLSRLVHALFERMEPVFGDMADEIARLEAEVLKEPNEDLRQAITGIRTQTIMFHRDLTPQREVVGRLRGLNYAWLTHTQKRHLQEEYNRITRYLEDLNEMRERAMVVQDELANALTARLNRNMYTVSVMSAIFLPLTFITGLMGMNVSGIPGAESTFGFVACLFMMGLIVAVQVAFFRRRKWF